MDEGASKSNLTSVATSKVEDDCELRENKDAVITTEGELKQTELKAAREFYHPRGQKRQQIEIQAQRERSTRAKQLVERVRTYMVRGKPGRKQ